MIKDMIKEIAIEPEVMATWSHFRELWEDCGVNRGRLISEFPGGWRDLVCKKALEKSSTKAGSIMARLKPSPGQGAVRKWIPTSRSYDGQIDWLRNAEKHEPPEAFDAIVASKNPRERSRVLVAGEFAKDQPPWKIPQQIEISRTPANLLACAGLLLKFSDELILVDYKFNATEARFREPFKAFVNARPMGKPWKKCELHVAHPPNQDRPDKNVLAVHIHHLRYHIPSLVPRGTTLRVHYWCRRTGGKKLHPRFIMTELGGIQYDYGLDEGDGPGDTTLVALMEQKVWEDARAGFKNPSPSFDITPDCIVDIPGEG